MDAKIWSELQHHIDLSIVYAKLPFQEFFQLRLVCKEWNGLAHNHQFLEKSFKEPIPKPYFVLRERGFSDVDDKVELHGLLTLNSSSGLWSWAPLPTSDLRSSLDTDTGVVALEGLLHTNITRSCDFKETVFNIHTRSFSVLPRSCFNYCLPSYFGLIVDTSVHPYSYKVIQGSSSYPTMIYDADTDSWSRRSSYMPQDIRRPFRRAYCVQCNGCLYIKSYLEKSQEIMVYDLEEDIWSTLDVPLRIVDEYHSFAIGAWQGRLFELTDYRATYTVWELVDRVKGEWKEYLRMPDKFSVWINHSSDGKMPEFQVHTSFCDNYLLVYSWDSYGARAKRFVLCDLALKKWKKLGLEVGVGFKFQTNDHFGEWEGDAEDDEYEDYIDEYDEVEGYYDIEEYDYTEDYDNGEEYDLW